MFFWLSLGIYFCFNKFVGGFTSCVSFRIHGVTSFLRLQKAGKLAERNAYEVPAYGGRNRHVQTRRGLLRRWHLMQRIGLLGRRLVWKSSRIRSKIAHVLAVVGEQVRQFRCHFSTCGVS